MRIHLKARARRGRLGGVLRELGRTRRRLWPRRSGEWFGRPTQRRSGGRSGPICHAAMSSAWPRPPEPGSVRGPHPLVGEVSVANADKGHRRSYPSARSSSRSQRSRERARAVRRLTWPTALHEKVAAHRVSIRPTRTPCATVRRRPGCPMRMTRCRSRCRTNLRRTPLARVAIRRWSGSRGIRRRRW